MPKRIKSFSCLLVAFFLLGQGCAPAPDLAQIPTLTDAPPTPTSTLIPATFTAVPPTPVPPTATAAREVIAAGNVGRLISIWSYAIPDDSFRTAEFSPDGRLVAAGSGENLTSPDQKLRVWDAATGELLAESGKLDTIIWDLVYSPMGDSLAAALENGIVQIRGSQDLALNRQIYFPGAVNSLAFSPDGSKLAAGVAENGSGMVYLIDLASGDILLSFWAHPYSVPALDFSPDGSMLATGAVDRTVKVWESASGGLLQSLPQDGQGSTLAFSGDGGLLASGYCVRSVNYVCQEGGVLLWSTTTWSVFKNLSGPTNWVEGLAFSKADDLLAGVDRNGYLHFWRVADGLSLRVMQINSYGSEAIAISRDGYSLLTGSAYRVGLRQIGQ